MIKRIIIEVRVPDGEASEIIINKVFAATIGGLNMAKQIPNSKFEIIHQRIEDANDIGELK